MSEQRDEFKKASDKFHMALGYCIVRWAEVEEWLFRICHTALQCPPQQAAIVYFRTPSLDARLSLVTELYESRYPMQGAGEHRHDDVKQWRKLESEIRDLLAVRRRLAHHPTDGIEVPYEADAAGVGEPPIKGTIAVFTTFQSEHERWRGKHPNGLPALTYAALEKHYAKLADIVGRLERVSRALRERVDGPITRRKSPPG